MKLTLIVLTCLVGVSRPERYIWPEAGAFTPAEYLPLFYANGVPAGYDVVRQSGMELEEEVASNPTEADNKLLFGALLSSVANLGQALVTSTSIVTSTLTATYTTPYTVQCIPSTAFVTTTACRRRRDIALVDVDHIDPYPPTFQVEASDIMHLAAGLGYDKAEEPVISSSQSNELYGVDQEQMKLLVGALSSLTTVISVTSYTTSFSLIPLSVTTTVSVGATTGLLCLPSGYAVC